MHRGRKHHEGYTLLELMATILIIGILAAMAAPLVGGSARERRKVAAAHDVVRSFRRARSRAIESGRAHMLRYDRTAYDGRGTLQLVRGTTNLCRTSEFAAPLVENCPSGTSGNQNLLCSEWWDPRTYEAMGSRYTISLQHTTVKDVGDVGAPNSQSTLSGNDPDFCFEGSGVMFWRLDRAGSFSDTARAIGGTTLSGSGFTFSVHSLEDGADRGVVRRILVPFGAEARSIL